MALKCNHYHSTKGVQRWAHCNVAAPWGSLPQDWMTAMWDTKSSSSLSRWRIGNCVPTALTVSGSSLLHARNAASLSLRQQRLAWSAFQVRRGCRHTGKTGHPPSLMPRQTRTRFQATKHAQGQDCLMLAHNLHMHPGRRAGRRHASVQTQVLVQNS